MTSSPTDLELRLGPGFFSACLLAALRAGVLPGRLRLSRHGDEWQVDGVTVLGVHDEVAALELSVRYRAFLGWSEEQHVGTLPVEARVRLADGQLHVDRVRLASAGRSLLESWGERNGRLDLVEEVGEAMVAGWVCALPLAFLGSFPDAGVDPDGVIHLRSGRARPAPQPAPVAGLQGDLLVTASLAGLKRLVPGLKISGESLLLADAALKATPGGLALSPPGAPLPPLLRLLTGGPWMLINRPVDPLHDEVDAVILDGPALLDKHGLVLQLSARVVRYRQAHAVQLIDVLRPGPGPLEVLVLRTEAGIRVELPLSRARSALARRALLPATVDPRYTLAADDRGQLEQLGLLCP